MGWSTEDSVWQAEKKQVRRGPIVKGLLCQAVVEGGADQEKEMSRYTSEKAQKATLFSIRNVPGLARDLVSL